MLSCSEPTKAGRLRRLGRVGPLWLVWVASAAWALPAAAEESANAGATAAHVLVPTALAAATAPAASAATSIAAAANFGVHDFDWVDSARDRAVPVRLYLPKSADARKPVPLIVFSHGIGGSRRGYSYLGQHWASQGYASLHLQHSGSDRGLWTGNPLSLVFRLQAAAHEGEAVARVHDLRFALDRVLAGEFGARLDATRIAAAGHSYGANTALLAAGAQVERQGQVMPLRDARIRCAIVISAPPFYGETDALRILGPISVPTLHVTATEDVIRVPGYYSPASDRLAVFDATGGADKVLAVFAGGSHSVFTDRAGTGGVALNPQVKAATQALSVAFLKQVFEGEPQALRQWSARFAAIVARFTAVP